MADYSARVKSIVTDPQIKKHPQFDSFAEACSRFYAAEVSYNSIKEDYESRQQEAATSLQELEAQVSQIEAISQSLELDKMSEEEKQEALHTLAGAVVTHIFENRTR